MQIHRALIVATNVRRFVLADRSGACRRRWPAWSDFKEEVLDALRGSIPAEPHLHPINLLEQFIWDLERADVIALVAGNDPDAHRELLADVKLMQEQLAAINAAEPVPER